MKILVVVPYLSNGGAERAMFNLSLYFSRAGNKVTIAAASDDAPNKEFLPAETDFFTLNNNEPFSKPAFLSNTKKLLKVINTCKPEIVFCTSDYLDVAVLLAKKISKIKFKVVIRLEVNYGNYIKGLPLMNRLFIKMLHRFISSNADRIVGVSEGVCKNYASMYNLKYPSDRLSVNYNPIFEPAIIQKSLIKPVDEKFKTSAINIITIGRLIRQKGQVTLIKAFSQLLKTHPLAKLFIIGEGPEEESLKQLTLSLSLGQQVVFLGYQKNPYSFINCCNLFVLSSLYEGFGNVIVEALAVGINVVSTDCPSGPAEILNYGEYGFLCEPQNEKELADTMIAALKSPIGIDKLQKRAQVFSIEKSGSEFIAMFKQLTRSKE